MVIKDPLPNLDDALKTVAPRSSSEGHNDTLVDEPAALAEVLGRSRVTYEPVWAAVERNGHLWTPVLCNSYRRALLLASSAIQHRTKAFEVRRFGRLVCIRNMQEMHHDAIPATA